MPNPLVNGPERTISKETPDRDAIEPIIERYKGFNIPYRGVMPHGVDSEPEFPELVDYSNQREDYEPYPAEIPPVPVVVMNTDNPRERAAFRVVSVPLQPISVQALGRDVPRTRVHFNGAQGDIWIGSEPFTVTYDNATGDSSAFPAAYPLRKTQLTLVSDEPIYLAGLGTATMLVEYSAP